MNSLADYLSISKEHLARIFRDKMGTTFKKHLTKVRTYHAYKLLSGSDLPIIEIALDTGFSDSRAFIASFKKTYGTTPGSYRRKYKQTVYEDFRSEAYLEPPVKPPVKPPV